MNLLKSGHEHKSLYYPYPARAKVEMTDSGYGWTWSATPAYPNINPLFAREYNGTMAIIGRSAQNRLLSLDYGDTWRQILANTAIPDQLAVDLMTDNPDVNKSIIVADESGNVYRSTDLNNDALSSWDLVLTMDNGYASRRYAWDLYQNVVLLAEYGSYQEVDPLRHIYISRDWGGTWKKSEIVAPENLPNPSKAHVHCPCYDPYSGRIWVNVGDGENSNTYYSDNWGDSWVAVFDSGASQKTTNIVSLPDKIVFGSDMWAEVTAVWDRPWSEQRPVVTGQDIRVAYANEKFDRKGIKRISVRPMMEPHHAFKTYPYHFIAPYEQQLPGGRACGIMASPDGEHWFEIFNSSQYVGFDGDTYLGPVTMYNDGIIRVGVYSGDLSKGFFFKITFPDWVRVD